MKILFTGGSSFTGYWFIRELVAAGHDVTAVFRRQACEQYTEEPRATRVSRLMQLCRPVFDCSFGGNTFCQLITGSGPFDVLCHHAAEVANYKSPDFDVTAAVSANTHHLRAVLDLLQQARCYQFVLTGSVFEGGEGAGSGGLPSFSPYGLSKSITHQIVEFYTRRSEIRLGKFVIPNPFGPYEEPRFTGYLVRSWYEGQVPTVNAPNYVRDNIHVSLLARAYRRFVERLVNGSTSAKFNPSGYVESQGAFAQRFAVAMQARLGIECRVQLNTQTDFSEPLARLNTDPLIAADYEWVESTAWDDLAAYYNGLLAEHARHPAIDKEIRSE